MLELLARARPASLDPGPATLLPVEAAARLAAANHEMADPAGAGAGSAAARPARRVPRVAVLTGTGLIAVAGWR